MLRCIVLVLCRRPELTQQFVRREAGEHVTSFVRTVYYDVLIPVRARLHSWSPFLNTSAVSCAGIGQAMSQGRSVSVERDQRSKEREILPW
jgi:hypothetical protein